MFVGVLLLVFTIGVTGVDACMKGDWIAGAPLVVLALMIPVGVLRLVRTTR